MTLTKNGKRVLGYFYDNPAGGISISEIYRTLDLDDSDRHLVEDRLVNDGMIQLRTESKDDAYYGITEYGKRVHESL